jgi:hypothetical protein
MHRPTCTLDQVGGRPAARTNARSWDRIRAIDTQQPTPAGCERSARTPTTTTTTTLQASEPDFGLAAKLMLPMMIIIVIIIVMDF